MASDDARNYLQYMYKIYYQKTTRALTNSIVKDARGKKKIENKYVLVRILLQTFPQKNILFC